jgi:hypothetical protein
MGKRVTWRIEILRVLREAESGETVVAESAPASYRSRGARSSLSSERCPFANLPEKTAGRWDQGLTSENMQECGNST